MRRLSFPDITTWKGDPLCPGLAYGWLGWPWAWRQLARQRLVPASPATERRVRAALGRTAASRAAHPAIGGFFGSAAAPLVAALEVSETARGGRRSLRLLRSWEAAVAQSSESDVLSGAAGALLAAGELHGYRGHPVSKGLVSELQRRCRRRLATLLLGGTRVDRPLGMAHGVSGILLALEDAKASFGLPFPSHLRGATLALLRNARIETPNGGWAWGRSSQEKKVVIHGWCHGAPGIGLAMLACHRLTGLGAYRALADRALTATAAMKTAHGNFCCGEIGRANILLEAFRQTGEARWLRAAGKSAETALQRPPSPGGLFAGELGWVLLRWRLRHPWALPFPGLGSLSASEPAHAGR